MPLSFGLSRVIWSHFRVRVKSVYKFQRERVTEYYSSHCWYVTRVMTWLQHCYVAILWYFLRIIHFVFIHFLTQQQETKLVPLARRHIPARHLQHGGDLWGGRECSGEDGRRTGQGEGGLNWRQRKRQRRRKLWLPAYQTYRYSYLPTIPILAELFRVLKVNSAFRFYMPKLRFFDFLNTAIWKQLE